MAVEFGGVTPVFCVRDLRTSLDYYTGVLGFEVDFSMGDFFASVSRGRCHIFLCVGDQGNPPAWIWVAVGDAEALYDELIAKGAPIRHPPTNYPWAYEMQVEDPDGNVLRLGSDEKEDAPRGPWFDMHGVRWMDDGDCWLRVTSEALDSAVAQQLIAALNAELAAQYADIPGSTHFRLDADDVAPGRGAFLVGWSGDEPVGCGAIRRLDDGSAEIKRMYVVPDRRGRGYGRKLLHALIDEARRLGIRRVVLETGNRQLGALALYRSYGFVEIPAYGEYVNSPSTSVCMAKDV